MTPDRLRAELLGPLHMHFAVAGSTYRDYLENGRRFLYASSLRRTNASARRLLLMKGHLLPEQYRRDAIALIKHYDAWLTLWDELAGREKPGHEDSFVFESTVSYPKEAELALERLHQRACESLGTAFPALPSTSA